MTGGAEIIAEVRETFLAVGLSNFILIVVVGLVVWAVVRGRISGASTKDAIAEAVVPMTCMWSQAERKDLSAMLHRMERIERDLAVLKDRSRYERE